jgi:CubicO group peptidase (beta-lactamase class C family)
MVSTQSALAERVLKLVDRQITAGDQVGVQVAAYRHGKPILDLAAGIMGAEDTRPVRGDTHFNCYSTTKGVAALAVHMCADRGLLDYDAPVAKYWPEFAQNGKDRVTVAQAMSHQAGLHATPSPLTADFITDWDAGIKWIAEGVPAWAPGTATGYHAITYAWVAGGIVQGASRTHIKDFIAREIAAPLGMSDEMFVGIPDGVEHRLATLIELDDSDFSTTMPVDIPADADFFKAMPRENDFSFNDMRIRKACIPSANGHFTARALARMYGALANGGEIDGARLVTKERIAHIQKVYTDAPDRVLIDMPLPKGVGFMMGGEILGVTSAYGPRRTAFGHSGAGGSTAFADPDTGLAMAVTINKMQMSFQAEGPTWEICNFVRTELGI